jgi:transposase-like protein
LLSGIKVAQAQQNNQGEICCAGYRFPRDVISYAVWLYYHFPLSLRMDDELLAAHGIDLIYETVRRWSVKYGLGIARRIRSTALARGDTWHLDEVVVTTNGKKHWLWRAVDQHGAVLDVLVQSRRHRHAARRPMRKLLRKHGRSPRVLVTDKLGSHAAANRDLRLSVEHRQRVLQYPWNTSSDSSATASVNALLISKLTRINRTKTSIVIDERRAIDIRETVGHAPFPAERF